MGVTGLFSQLKESRTYFPTADILWELVKGRFDVGHAIHIIVDMSVIMRIMSSIHPRFPAYRFFADEFKDDAAKVALYNDLAQRAVKYMSFLLIPGAIIHLVLERQSGGKVTKDKRSRHRAKTISNGLDLIYSSTSHGHKSQGKELINQCSSFSQYDQAEILKCIIQLNPGIRLIKTHYNIKNLKFHLSVFK